MHALIHRMICIISAGCCINMVAAATLIPEALPKTSRQLIIVTQQKGVSASVVAMQKTNYSWKQAMAPIPAVVGSQGVALAGEKEEGDNKTPSGLYALGPAYGTEPLALKMDYRYITDADKFIDDPQSPDYNSWVSGTTDAKSYEIMNRSDGIYKYGLVINYNMSPVVPEKGSAIFMHIWYGPNIGTTGCIAMEAKNMLKLLKWLNKKDNPYILIKRD